VTLERARPLLVGAIALTVLGYAWWATTLRPFTAPALVATVGAGLVALLLGSRLGGTRHERVSRSSSASSSWSAGLTLWGVLVLGLALWELTAYLQQPRADHPTLSSLADSALDRHAPRALALALWLGVSADLGRR
jgi:hypothetical protein